MGDITCQRVYTDQHGKAHLVDELTSLNAFPYAAALCGREPSWPFPWMGTGNQKEHEKAAQLSLCKLCAKELDPK